MHAVACRNVDGRGGQPPGSRRDAVGAPERAGECLIGGVTGVDGGVEHRGIRGPEPEGRALEQEPAAQPGRGFAGSCGHDPVQQRPGQVQPVG